MEDCAFFGAYLAGVIDGDGDIRLKIPQYPQCVIRINSGFYAENLLYSLKSKLNINTSILKQYNENTYEDRKISGYSYGLEFCVSSKNCDFFERYVLDNMSLFYKKDKITNHINFQNNAKHLNKKFRDNPNIHGDRSEPVIIQACGA